MAARWFLARNQKKIGPFSSEQLKHLAECGFVQPGEHVLVEGGSKWVEARTVPGLFAAEAAGKYWVSVNGQTRGPYVAEQIQAGLTTRQFTMETQVYSDRSKKWVTLRQATEFHGYSPSTVSHSQAQLLAGSLDLDEARLHLAGKEGDDLAHLMSMLLDLKRTYQHHPEFVANLDHSLAQLQARRERAPTAAAPKQPDGVQK